MGENCSKTHASKIKHNFIWKPDLVYSICEVWMVQCTNPAACMKAMKEIYQKKKKSISLSEETAAEEDHNPPQEHQCPHGHAF
jgi:hypothetical protein